MKQITREWLNAAKDDILVKAVLEEYGINVPKTHDLIRLYSAVSNLVELELDLKVMRRVNETYIDTRYPGDMGLLPNGKPAVEEAIAFAFLARKVFGHISITLANG